MKETARDDSARLTKLLVTLEEAALSKALDLKKQTIDESTSRDFEKQVARAHHRCDPNRAKRTARGSYKKENQVCGVAHG